MLCIKKMKNITNLDLSHNEFTQIQKSAFANLGNLKYLDFSFNNFKKLGPQMFSSATGLVSLSIDKFKIYKNVRQSCSKLSELHLTTKEWNCSFLEAVAGVLNAQKIYINFNDDQDQNFTCTRTVESLNKITL